MNILAISLYQIFHEPMIQQDIVSCSNGMWLGKKIRKMYLYTLKILHYISELNFVAHGVKFGVLKLICIYAQDRRLSDKVDLTITV